MTINKSISYLLVEIMKIHRNRINRSYQEIGLHVGQDMLLFQLWEREGINQTELAHRLSIEPATIAKMINRMENNGILIRNRHSQDARISLIYLTEYGRSLEKVVQDIWIRIEKDLLVGFNDEEKRIFHHLLMQVNQNL